MRAAAEAKVRAGAQKSTSVSLPAPVGGLNARDSIANMPATDALRLENFFPTETSVDRRNGNASFATFTGLCDTACDYTGLTGTKLFVGVNNAGTYSLIEATAGGAISTPVVGGGGSTVQALTSARFDWINVGTTAGQFLLLCNGADPMLEYDGTTWSVGSITGVTGGTDEIKSIALYNERVWLMAKNTFDVYYLDIGAKSGAATKLNLGTLFKLGGSMAALVTVSLDSASAIADHIGFLSNQGELIVYKGNPADSDSWQRVSHVRMGRPITYGVRAWCKLGSDALVACVDGVMPLSKIIATDRADIRYAASDKIRKLVTEAVTNYGSLDNWGIAYHPYGRKVILNVPTETGAGDTASFQYVMNSETKAWCKFTNWQAICWLVVRDTLYFGMEGKLVQADTGARDYEEANVDDEFIYAYGKQAFNYFGMRGRLKHFKEMRVNSIWTSGYTGTINMGLNIDFQDAAPTDFLNQAVASTGGVEVDTVVSEWIGVSGVGYCAAPYVAINPVNILLTYSWVATDIIFETGGLL